MLLEGMYLPLTTPFTLDGELNLARLEANVARYSKTPAAGLVALSHWGQPGLLTNQEQRAVLKTVAAAAAPTKVLVAGIHQDAVSHALDTISYAAECGYDVALIRRPTMQEGDQERCLREAMLYLTSVADGSPLPILLTSSAASALPDDVLVSLASHPNILGVVLEEDADEPTTRARIAGLLGKTGAVRREVVVTQVFAPVTRRMLAAEEVAAGEAGQFVTAASLATGTAVLSAASAETKPRLKTRTKAIGFQVLAGSSATLLDSLEAGAVGIMPGFAGSAPQACYEVIAAWKDGDPALAAEKQHRVQPMAVRIEQQLGVAGLKYAAELTGYFGGRTRLPGLSLTAAEREEVEALMQGIRN